MITKSFLKIHPEYASKPINSLKFEALLDNRLKNVSSKALTVRKVAHEILKGFQAAGNAISFPYSVRLSGSSLVNASLENPAYMECNDIDLKIVVLDDKGENQEQIFSRIDGILQKALGTSLKRVDSHAFYPLSSQYRSGYCLKGQDSTQLPLDITVLVLKDPKAPIHVSNADSLYVELNLFEEDIGTETEGKFLLSSEEGDASLVLQAVENKIITIKEPRNAEQFSWYRYLMLITEGFTDPVSCNNEILYEQESRAGAKIVPNMKKFVKKRRSFLTYEDMLLANALFHCKQTKDGDLLPSLFRAASNPFFSGLLSGSCPERHLPTLIKLLFPLLAEEVSVKMHLGESELQCVFVDQGQKFHVMVPFLKEEDLIYFQDLNPLLKGSRILNDLNLEEQEFNISTPPEMDLQLFKDLPELRLAWDSKFSKIFKQLENSVEKEEELDVLVEKTFALTEKLLKCPVVDFAKGFPWMPLFLQMLAKMPEDKKIKTSARLIRSFFTAYLENVSEISPFLWQDLLRLYSFLEVRKILPSYFLSFLTNAVFQGVSIDRWRDCFNKIKEVEKTSWMRFAADYSTKCSEKQFQVLLQLLLPLFANKVSLKREGKESYFGCDLTEEGGSLPILVPLLKEEDFFFVPDLLPLFSDRKLFDSMKLDPQSIPDLKLPPFPLSDFSIAWALKFPDNFRPFLRDVGLKTLLQDPIVSSFSRSQDCIRFIAEEEVSRKVDNSFRNGNIALAKTQMLLSKDLSLEELLQLLPGADVRKLQDKGIEALIERIPFFVGLLTKSPFLGFEKGFPLTSFLVDLVGKVPLSSKAKISSGVVRELLKAPKISEALWKDLNAIAKEAIKEQAPLKPWKSLLIPFVLNAIESSSESCLEFLTTLSSSTEAVPLSEFPDVYEDAQKRLTYHIHSFALFKRVDDLERALELDAKKSIRLCAALDRNSFEEGFKKVMTRIKTDKALSLLQVREEELGAFPSFYVDLLGIKESSTDQEAVFEAYVRSLSKSEDQKMSLLSVYQSFSSIPIVINTLENTCFCTQEWRDFLEKNKELKESIQPTISSRIDVLLQGGKPKKALQLSELLTESQAVPSLIKIAIHSLKDPLKRKEVIQSILQFFPLRLKEVLDGLAAVQNNRDVHLFLFDLVSIDPEKELPEQKRAFFALFTKQLPQVCKDPEGLERLNTYLEMVSDEERLAFSLASTSREVFSLAFDSVTDVKTSVINHNWAQDQKSLKTLIERLMESNKFSEDQIEMIFEKMEDFTQFTVEIENMLPFMKEVPNVALAKIIALSTSEPISCLGFLLSSGIASSLFLKDPNVYNAFLKCSAAFLDQENKKRQERTAVKIGKILQNPPCKVIDLENLWKTIFSYMDAASFYPSLKTDWIAEELVKEFQNPVLLEIIKKVPSFSSKIAIRCVEAILPMLNAGSDDESVLILLYRYLSPLSKSPLTLSDRKRLTPTFQVLAQYFEEMRSRTDSAFLSKCSQKVIFLCLQGDLDEQVGISRDLVHDVHIMRVMSHVETAIKIDLEMHWLFVEKILARVRSVEGRITHKKNVTLSHDALKEILEKLKKDKHKDLASILSKTLEVSTRICEQDVHLPCLMHLMLFGTEFKLGYFQEIPKGQEPLWFFKVFSCLREACSCRGEWNEYNLAAFLRTLSLYKDKIIESPLNPSEKEIAVARTYSLEFLDKVNLKLFNFLAVHKKIECFDDAVCYLEIAFFLYSYCSKYFKLGLAKISDRDVLNVCKLLISFDCRFSTQLLTRITKSDGAVNESFLRDLREEVRKHEDMTINRIVALSSLDYLLGEKDEGEYLGDFLSRVVGSAKFEEVEHNTETQEKFNETKKES